MFVLVVLPTMGKTKMRLSSVEMSPLARDNYQYKAQKLVSILLYVYIGLTLSETVLLRLVGMDWFDAITHSFSTVATGGFSTKNLSIAHYNNFAIEFVVMFFMALSGIHFGLIFATFTGKRNNLFRSEVARFYIATFTIAGMLISLSLWGADIYGSIWESLRHGMFQSIAIITTTGFATADTTLWTSFSIIILIVLMFQCGCAGSTSGGIKSDRVWLAIKTLRAQILQQQHPRAVIRVRLNGVTQDEAFIGYSMLFIVVYILLVVVGSIVMAATGLDLMTSFSMVAASIGNIGPGFGDVGSMSNYAEVSPFAKTFCSLYMLLGRLEIFGLIQLLFFRWWR